MIEFFGRQNDVLYFDNAASTLALKSVVDKSMEFLSTYGSIHRGVGYNSEHSTELYECAREYILKCLQGTDNHTVIFTSNTTDGINKVCSILELSRNDTVIVSDIEHSANILPYMQVSKVKRIDTGDTNIVTADMVESMLIQDSSIKLVALAAANNVTGYITPFNKIYEVCKRYGAIFLLDCSQYAPHYRMGLNMADILVYSGHKMYAPFGIGVIAGRKDLISKHGRYEATGGGNVIYFNDKITYYKESPYSHEVGTPNGVGAIAIAEAHRVLYEDIDLNSHTKSLVNNMLNMKLNKNFSVFFNNTEDKTPVFVFKHNTIPNKDICSKLGDKVFLREGAFCSYRLLEKTLPSVTKIMEGNKLNPEFSLIRASAGLVNDESDFATLEQRLNNIDL
jgi:possible selenocysteine lyase (aminotransferase of nifS family)